MSPMEGFLVYLKVSLYCGVILASPWIFYQLWSFVAVGLYPHEKRLVNVYLPFSIGLFLAGVALCEFVVIPAALKYLLSFNASMQAEPNLRLSEWLSFAILTPLVFGAAFQLPLVMVVMNRLGILDAAAYRKHRRYAMFLMADPGRDPGPLAGLGKHAVVDRAAVVLVRAGDSAVPLVASHRA